MAKKRAVKEPLPEVPPATYEDSESLIPAGSEPAMPSAPEPEVEAAPPEPPVVPHLDWYRTKTPGRVYVEGAVCHLAVGSLVSAATHDLDALRSSGVVLEPCERIQRALDAYGEAS